MIDWHTEIARASTRDQLVEVAREFLASLTHLDLRELPERCRPARIREIDDLRHWHDCVVEAYCELAGRTAPTRTHSELVLFFTAAIERATGIDRIRRQTQPADRSESRA